MLALAYQVTGNTSYGTKAVQKMLTVAVPATDMTADSCYNYRIIFPDLAAGYDWCYPLMSATDKATIAKWLMDWSDYVWPETNPARAGAWAINDPSNNYYYGFLMTWAAAIAVSGDEPRAANHLSLAMSKYRNVVQPFLNGWGAGGVFAESTNYDSSQRLSLLLDGHCTGTGQDLINEPGFTFIKDSLYWRIYSTTPKLDQVYQLGDQSRVSMGPLCDYDRFRAFVGESNIADPAAAQYSKFWLDTITPNQSSWSFVAAWEFLYYDGTAPSTDYRQALPLAYLAKGPGVFLRRSDWTANATYWGIWSGPLQGSHQNQDVNGFLIYKGGWLVGNDTMYSQSGIMNTTVSQNNITIGGTGQTWQVPDSVWPSEAGRVVTLEDTSQYSYFAGWGSQAYVQARANGGTPILNDYVRKLVNVSPDIFFVYDRVSVINSASPKEWHLHSGKQINVSGRSYVFDNGSAQLCGQSLLPASGVTVSQTPVPGGISGATSSYRLDVVTNNGQPTDWMLNVLQVTPLAAAQPSAQAVVASTGNMEGGLAGNWLVMFGKSEPVTASVSYSYTNTAATEHLIVDLMPNTAYQVSVIQSGSTGTTSTYTTTANGSLRLSVPAGSYTISLSPSGTVASLASIQLPSSAVGGTSVAGTVTLSGPAPSGGAVISLSSGNISLATVPTSVTIPAGTTQAAFNVQTSAVTTNTSVTISAKYNTVTLNAGLQLTPASTGPSLSGISAPSTVTGGTSATGTVTLSGPAPSSGVSVGLSSSNSNLISLPTSVTVIGGATQANFTFQASTVASNTSVNINGAYNGSSVSTPVVVTPAPPPPVTISSLTVPSPVTGGTSVTGNVVLSGNAPSGGQVVTFSCTGTVSAITMPSSVTVPAGSNTVSFNIQTASVTSTTSVGITGSCNNSSQSASMQIQPATQSPTLTLTVTPSRTVGGTIATAVVDIGVPAGANGVTISVSANKPRFVNVPTSVTIPAGQRQVSFPVTTKRVTSTIMVVLDASYKPLGLDSKTKLTLTP